MKYILFEKSAAEEIITKSNLQSYEYQLSQHFISFIRDESSSFSMSGLVSEKHKNGIMFVGPLAETKILLIDLEQCRILEETTNDELMLVLQKLLRFAIRYWNKQSFTSAENIINDKAVIFPFPYSQKKAYRIVVAREPSCPRLQTRGISFSLLAYKYNDKGAPKGAETPSTSVYQKAGELYLDRRYEIKHSFEISSEQEKDGTASTTPLCLVEANNLSANPAFNYMSLDQQIAGLTKSQQYVVESENTSSPIRVEGPAGTGKTVSLVIRAALLLRKARKEGKPLKVAFFTHSKTTEISTRTIFDSSTENQWKNSDGQSIDFITLQEYCTKYINLSETQIIDGDAYEAKQYQLLVIQDIYSIVSQKYYSTYRPHLSEKLKNILDHEDAAKIVSMLQHEFSVQIKGFAAEDFDVYKNLSPLSNGLPATNEDDKTYIFRIFTEYQEHLKRESVFDTDDVVLEATSRFRGPLWKRERKDKGFDYIFADEMHLFNLNEQQVFHYLTKNIEQAKIPICFALDYSQAIGDRGDVANNYVEKELSTGEVISQEYNTVFRSSQEIAELCASITSSGATLFSSFINPYKTAQSGFTAKEDALCQHPTLYMYNSDSEMLLSLKKHIDSMIKSFQCCACDIAVIVFGQDGEIDADAINKYSNRTVTELISRNSVGSSIHDKNSIILSTPENVNGLEFCGAILVGVDEGRVPVTSVSDISENFMRFRALNQLYLACSRAKYQVRILGNSSRGISSCLTYSLNNKTLLLNDTN